MAINPPPLLLKREQDEARELVATLTAERDSLAAIIDTLGVERLALTALSVRFAAERDLYRNAIQDILDRNLLAGCGSALKKLRDVMGVKP